MNVLRCGLWTCVAGQKILLYKTHVLSMAQHRQRYKPYRIVRSAAVPIRGCLPCLTVLGQDYLVSDARPTIQIQKLSAVHGARLAPLTETRPAILIHKLCAVHGARIALLIQTRSTILVQKLCAVHGARLALVTETRQDSQDQQH